MRRLVPRVPARAVLVLVGVALCVFGPTRAATSHAAIAADGTVASSGAMVGTVDHAVVDRVSATTGPDWSKFAIRGAIPVIAAVLVLALAAVADFDRVIVALVGVPWRRRGPPT